MEWISLPCPDGTCCMLLADTCNEILLQSETPRRVYKNITSHHVLQVLGVSHDRT